MNLLSQKRRATSTVRATQRRARHLSILSRLLRHRLPPRICRLLRTTPPRLISTRRTPLRPTRTCQNPSSTAKSTAWSRITRRRPHHRLRCKNRQSRVSLAKLLLRQIHLRRSLSTCATVRRSTRTRLPRLTATPKTSRRSPLSGRSTALCRTRWIMRSRLSVSRQLFETRAKRRTQRCEQ